MTTRIWKLASLSLAFALVAGVQASAQQGRHESKVRQALEAGAGGECPSSIMAPSLRGACLSQMPGLSQMLSRGGRIVGLEYLGNESLQNGVSVEVYRVKFERGSMVWQAASGADGKLNVLFSGG